MCVKIPSNSLHAPHTHTPHIHEYINEYIYAAYTLPHRKAAKFGFAPRAREICLHTTARAAHQTRYHTAGRNSRTTPPIGLMCLPLPSSSIPRHIHLFSRVVHARARTLDTRGFSAATPNTIYTHLRAQFAHSLIDSV